MLLFVLKRYRPLPIAKLGFKLGLHLIRYTLMNFKIICLALVALSSQPSYSQTLTDYDALYNTCLEQAGDINNSVVAMCASEVSTRANQEIKRRYQSIYAYLLNEHAADAEQFSASQKAWRTYRDTHCELAGSYVGSPMYDYCPMGLNAARALELRELDQEQ